MHCKEYVCRGLDHPITFLRRQPRMSCPGHLGGKIAGLISSRSLRQPARGTCGWLAGATKQNLTHTPSYRSCWLQAMRTLVRTFEIPLHCFFCLFFVSSPRCDLGFVSTHPVRAEYLSSKPPLARSCEAITKPQRDLFTPFFLLPHGLWTLQPSCSPVRAST
jgi:hypothetical protein